MGFSKTDDSGSKSQKPQKPLNPLRKPFSNCVYLSSEEMSHYSSKGSTHATPYSQNRPSVVHYAHPAPPVPHNISSSMLGYAARSDPMVTRNGQVRKDSQKPQSIHSDGRPIRRMPTSAHGHINTYQLIPPCPPIYDPAKPIASMMKSEARFYTDYPKPPLNPTSQSSQVKYGNQWPKHPPSRQSRGKMKGMDDTPLFIDYHYEPTFQRVLEDKDSTPNHMNFVSFSNTSNSNCAEMKEFTTYHDFHHHLTHSNHRPFHSCSTDNFRMKKERQTPEPNRMYQSKWGYKSNSDLTCNPSQACPKNGAKRTLASLFSRKSSQKKLDEQADRSERKSKTMGRMDEYLSYTHKSKDSKDLEAEAEKAAENRRWESPSSKQIKKTQVKCEKTEQCIGWGLLLEQKDTSKSTPKKPKPKFAKSQPKTPIKVPYSRQTGSQLMPVAQPPPGRISLTYFQKAQFTYVDTITYKRRWLAESGKKDSKDKSGKFEKFDR